MALDRIHPLALQHLLHLLRIVLLRAAAPWHSIRDKTPPAAFSCPEFQMEHPMVPHSTLCLCVTVLVGVLLKWWLHLRPLFLRSSSPDLHQLGIRTSIMPFHLLLRLPLIAALFRNPDTCDFLSTVRHGIGVLLLLLRMQGFRPVPASAIIQRRTRTPGLSMIQPRPSPWALPPPLHSFPRLVQRPPRCFYSMHGLPFSYHVAPSTWPPATVPPGSRIRIREEYIAHICLH
ncbi:hypothetical protein C8R44DRAFT_799165 [Mycena epipterygia]|nr:hypothetical protein C8R44DRAFT_799165 [Mycena epipterygia]